MCRIFMSHFIVYNFYNYYIQCLCTALTGLSARTDSRNFETSGLRAVCIVITNPDRVKRVKVQGIKCSIYCLTLSSRHMRINYFTSNFTINQTNHNNYMPSCHVFYRESESQSTRKVLFLPCSVFQHLC